MRRSYVLAILLLLAASPAYATPGWDKYVSSTGFSLEYPRRWAATNGRSNTYRDNGKYPDFVLRDGPDGPPHHGAVVLERWQAELKVREIDSPIDFAKIFEPLDSEEKYHRDNHDYYGNEHYKIKGIKLNHRDNLRCPNLEEIIYRDWIGGGGPRASDSTYTWNFDFYCTIGDRSFLISLEYWTTDRRAKELQRVVLRVAKSLRLVPAKPATAPAKQPPAAPAERNAP